MGVPVRGAWSHMRARIPTGFVWLGQAGASSRPSWKGRRGEGAAWSWGFAKGEACGELPEAALLEWPGCLGLMACHADTTFQIMERCGRYHVMLGCGEFMTNIHEFMRHGFLRVKTSLNHGLDIDP